MREKLIALLHLFQVHSFKGIFYSASYAYCVRSEARQKNLINFFSSLFFSFVRCSRINRSFLFIQYKVVYELNTLHLNSAKIRPLSVVNAKSTCSRALACENVSILNKSTRSRLFSLNEAFRMQKCIQHRGACV